MFPEIVGFPPKSSILMGFSIIFTIHFGGNTPIFGSTPICFPVVFQPAEPNGLFYGRFLGSKKTHPQGHWNSPPAAGKTMDAYDRTDFTKLLGQTVLAGV